MAIVRYRDDEVPPPTPEYEAEMKALAEMPDSEIDYSDIPEMDEFDFNYSVPLSELLAMSSSQRSRLGRKMLAAREADRAAMKARKEVEQAIAEARLITTPITN
jgi:hypothetical protein